MALQIGKEKWEEPQEVEQQSDCLYQFLDLESWLHDLNISHINNELKEQGFQTLDTLVQLNENDLDELCDTIKTKNVAFTLSEKGLFKSEIMKEKEKYNNYLLTKQLDSGIKMYEGIMNLSKKAINDCKLHQQSTMQSIIEISNQIQMVITNLCEIGFEKYLKGTYCVQKHANKSLLKLKEAKEKCEKTSTFDGIEDILDSIEDNTAKFMENGEKFIEDEIMPSMIQAFLTDVNIAKICQQLVSFGLVPFRHAMTSLHALEMEDVDTSSTSTFNAYLMILPHAIGYIDDIKQELSQRNVKITKQWGSIPSEKAALLLMKESASINDSNIHELAKEERIGYKPDQDDEDKTNDVDDDKQDEKEELDEFEIDPVYVSDAGHITVAVHYHLEKYFEEMGDVETMIYMIEMQQYSDDKHAEYFSNNFDVYCPAGIGEYASIYHPTSINGTFMNIYRETMPEKRLQSMVNLGFIQVISSEIWEEIFEEVEESD